MMDFLTGLFHDEFLTMSFRIILSLILSGLIGFEREVNRHSAGFRTHILVGVSATLLMLMSLYGFQDYILENQEIVRFDPARIPSYVVSGIGFLGAGTIIVTGMTVKGLTTAASIWAVAGLGLVVGIGMYDIAILTTVIILLSLIFLNRFEQFISRRKHITHVKIVIKNIHGIEDILNKCNQHDLLIKNMDIKSDENEQTVLETDIVVGKGINTSNFIISLTKLDDVISVQES